VNGASPVTAVFSHLCRPIVKACLQMRTILFDIAEPPLIMSVRYWFVMLKWKVSW